MKKTIILFALLFLALSACSLSGTTGRGANAPAPVAPPLAEEPAPTRQPDASIIATTVPVTDDANPDRASLDRSTVVIRLTSKDFRFYREGVESPTLRVRAGDTVRVELAVEEGFHDFVIDEFSAATGQVGTGKSTTVEFTAPRVGTYEYYCSVGSHRAMGMKGQFIVE